MSKFVRAKGPEIIEKTASSPLLSKFYSGCYEKYNGDYPIVKNPPALIEGLEKICKALCGDAMPDCMVLYVIEPHLNPEQEISKAQYMIIVRNERVYHQSAGKEYSISIVYKPTRETESISLIEEDKVIWSPDNIQNTQHISRTKYYMGFTYMICENSPGFDIEPVPDVELTGAELLSIITEGELPPEIIEIELPGEAQGDAQAQTGADESDWLDLFEDGEGESDILSGSGKDHEALPNEALDEAEDEYNDLAVDFEELFD